MSNDNKVTRKLRAILSADVKGYSLLMADDEVFTIRTLKEYREIMADLIKNNSGRVVDNPGDNLLAEFSSAVDAVETAVQIQNRLAKEKAKFVEDKRLQFRIGVNIGDVVHDGDRIYGSGVNVAARIEGIADPGGICISRGTYDQVKDKLDLGFEYLGEHEVKNIEEPVRVYKVLMGTDAPKPLVEEELKLPDKPSIAVLPFDNMSGDPDQEYFSDGLTEQIINGLCKVSNLFVIARNSSFAYKGKAVSLKQIAKELGVQYILEGSVQRSGDRVRITAQLIDATTDYHMWSETYDRNLEDIFALQDEITWKMISLMQVKLSYGDQAKSWAKGTKNFKAFTHFLRGLHYINLHTIEDSSLARHEAEEAIRFDPNYPSAHSLLAGTYLMSLWWETGFQREHAIKISEESLNKALELDHEYSSVYVGFGMLNYFRGQMDEAIKNFRKSIEINPNNAKAYMQFGYVLHCKDKNEDALRMMGKGFMLNPFPSNIEYVQRGDVYFWLQNYDKAVRDYQAAVNIQHTDIYALLGLIASFQCLGLLKEARNKVKEFYKYHPNFTWELLQEPGMTEEEMLTTSYYVALRDAGIK
jgi:adenylate cyclase